MCVDVMLLRQGSRWPVVCCGTRDGDMEEERRQKNTRELAVNCLLAEMPRQERRNQARDYERDGLDYSTACESVMFGGKKMKKQGVGSIESIRPPHA